VHPPHIHFTRRMPPRGAGAGRRRLLLLVLLLLVLLLQLKLLLLRDVALRQVEAQLMVRQLIEQVQARQRVGKVCRHELAL
jgi:hypothetical protein